MKRLLYFTIPALIVTASCNKTIPIDLPISQLTTENVFLNDDNVASATAGLYAQMQTLSGSIMNGGTTVFTGLASDELRVGTTNADATAYFANALTPAFSNLRNNFWSSAYITIYHCNLLIKGLLEAKTLTDSVRKQSLGEAYFIRAFLHFELTNLFGDVPLITSTDYRVTSILPRSASGQVYQQITEDLLKTQDLLSTGYPTAGRVRPNKWTAISLLARVYLYQKNWMKAEELSTMVINNTGMYSLLATANIGNVFLAASPEAIWQLQPVSTSVNTTEGLIFIPSSTTAIPTYPVTGSLFNSFEAGDLRKARWLNSNTINSQVYYYPYKYKVRAGVAPYAENYIVLRLAEQYLIRAEARTQLDNTTGAQTDLNTIRTRAGLGNTIAATRDALLLAIEKERRIELFAEWGHRWFDLKRTARVDVVIGNEKGANWQPADALFPIPAQEILNNPQLIQNPGY